MKTLPLIIVLISIIPFLSVAQDTKNTKRKSVWEQMGEHGKIRIRLDK